MLVEVEYQETTVNTIPDNLFETIVNSRPFSFKSQPVTNYDAIIRAGMDKLFGEIPSYLKEQEKHKEDYLQWKESQDTDELMVKQFLEEILALQEKMQLEDCMYRVYEQMSMWSIEHKLKLCDDLLDCIKVELFDIHVLLSLLMATFPMRKRLNYRSVFFSKVQNHVRKRYSEDKMNELFVGLE